MNHVQFLLKVPKQKGLVVFEVIALLEQSFPIGMLQAHSIAAIKASKVIEAIVSPSLSVVSELAQSQR